MRRFIWNIWGFKRMYAQEDPAAVRIGNPSISEVDPYLKSEVVLKFSYANHKIVIDN